MSMEDPALPPETDQPPDRSQELVDYALDWMQSSAIKVIGAKLLPLILGSGALATGLAWLQDAIGIDLSPAAVTGLIGTIIAGAVVMAFAYVRNHGRGAAQLGTALVELQKLREAGQQYFDPSTTSIPEPGEGYREPSVPPGIAGPGVNKP
jgi:hypothetical protein